jgi:hypothetical protein
MQWLNVVAILSRVAGRALAFSLHRIVNQALKSNFSIFMPKHFEELSNRQIYNNPLFLKAYKFKSSLALPT